MIKRNKKRGFTLVELLAVIVILAIILVIAVPKIMNTIKDTTKASFESSAKMVAAQVENQYTVAKTLGKEFGSTGDCKQDWAGLNSTDYESCTYDISDGTAKITLVGKGKFKDLKIVNGTRNSATAIDGGSSSIALTVNLNGGTGKLDYKSTYKSGEIVELTEPTKEGYSFAGWTVTGTNAKATKTRLTMGNDATTITAKWQEIINCTYDGELVQGAELIHNQYTYRYKQERDYDDYEGYFWAKRDQDGGGVMLTNKSSTEPVNTAICTYINGKPVDSMAYMFAGSAATELDLSSWNTSNITNMYGMFRGSAATTLDLSSFDTSNVTKMSYMFYYSAATSLDLSSFDTSNVTNMRYMFSESAATSLDLSSFDTSNVTDMDYMFEGSDATTIYVGDNWNVSNVTNDWDMFSGSKNLVGGNGTTYNDSYIDKTYARVDKEGEPGYFTYKASN